MLEDNSLHTENESGGVINKLQTGIYQADLFIAKRFLNKTSHCIVSSDRDFAVMIGNDLVLLKEFHYDYKKKKSAK